MSTDSNKLTADEPVDRETLGKLGELEQARSQLGGELMDIEQAKVKILAAAHRLDEQRNRLFEKILMDRGLPPNSVAEVDAQTGKIIVHRTPGAPPVANAPQVAASPTP